MDPKSRIAKKVINTKGVVQIIDAFISKNESYYWKNTPEYFKNTVLMFGETISIFHLKLLIDSKIKTSKMVGTANNGLKWILNGSISNSYDP